MSIRDNQDWKTVELRAQLAEAGQIHSEPVPPPPTVAQQLAFVTTRCAQLQARLRRQQTAMATAQMYLSIGEVARATEELNRAIIDL